jgi:hypothetical protein
MKSLNDEEDLTWGESFQGRKKSLTYTCPNRGCIRHGLDYILPKYHASISIGVKVGGDNPLMPYILTCECPECFTKYWFHITEDEAVKLAKSHKSKLEKGANL